MRRATECFSINSDISNRTIASSLSNMKFARALQSSVFPTPVGPRNRKEPLGRLGSDRPARERRTALETAFSASSCPTTLSRRASSMRDSFSLSPSIILDTGIPVQRDTTSAISSSVTLLRSSTVSVVSVSCACSSCFSNAGSRPYCSSDIRVRSPARRAPSRSSLTCSKSLLICAAPCTEAFSAFHISSRSENSRSTFSISSLSSSTCFLAAASVSFLTASRSILSWISLRSSLSMTSGLESISMRMRLAASSIRSIALSGN